MLLFLSISNSLVAFIKVQAEKTCERIYPDLYLTHVNVKVWDFSNRRQKFGTRTDLL